MGVDCQVVQTAIKNYAFVTKRFALPTPFALVVAAAAIPRVHDHDQFLHVPCVTVQIKQPQWRNQERS